jgi:hypothetical protein
VDPLVKDHGILADTALIIPKGCLESVCYDSISTYEVMRFNSYEETWEPVRFAGGDGSRYVRDF